MTKVLAVKPTNDVPCAWAKIHRYHELFDGQMVIHCMCIFSHGEKNAAAPVTWMARDTFTVELI